MSDLRKDLLRKIAELRSAVAPDVLNRAKLAAFGKVPFDRSNAEAAVGRFLAERKDGGDFQRKLEAQLRKEGAAIDLDALAGGDNSPSKPEAGGAAAMKPRRIGRIR